MKTRHVLAALLLLVAGFPAWSIAREKPRVCVLTDIENEPDDTMSMVRFLTFSNQWDVEGLVATTSIHQKSHVAPDSIRKVVAAYGQVWQNLNRNEPGFPSPEYLMARISEGLPVYGMQGVGPGKDSPGSELIIRAVDRDPRPLWVTVWGGPSVLAQALWKVRATRSPAELDTFVSRLRVYTISDQDDTGPWLRKTFPKLFYIVSPGFNAGGAYHHATWSGISGDEFHGRFTGADFSLVSNEWLDRNIRSKGPLGAVYPRWKFLMEGDTPSFLYLVDNGLGDPEHPDWGSWGGRYEDYTPRTQKWFAEPETRPIWTDAEDEVMGVDGKWHTGNHETIWRWRSAYQNEFAARMDWTIKPYAECNHPPVAKLGMPSRLTAKRGQRVDLSAVGSSDPDGDALSYLWFYYDEAGTFATSSGTSGQPVEIRDADQPKAWFTVPTSRVMRDGTMHVILAVTDHGIPRLTRYQRVIVTVEGRNDTSGSTR
ncbi:MAG TPA: nucleoside hydrolase-like domain-containing protein [Opitutaceae bacterium]|nr:nucleoside hydrolase-like domain-containing protein [Opitutaceae bacterium]